MRHSNPMKRRFRLRMVFALAALSMLCGLPSGDLRAQAYDQTEFEAYLQLVSARARSEGIGDAAITQVLSGLTPNPRVVQLDRRQPGRQAGPPPMAPYLRTHVNSTRIERGRDKYRQTAKLLDTIEGQYGVPGKMLVAIWGHETNYGSYTGDFDLRRSLATLAFEGRRRQLFEGELIALMKMVDQGVPAYRLKGSWAGALGNPQFLPSVYLTTAADGDGDGDRDIWSSTADTLASIANYFKMAGWRKGEPWGTFATVPPSFRVESQSTKLDAPSCSSVHQRHSVWRPVHEWRELGVQPLAPIANDTMASLFQPDGPGTPTYLLTGNYRVILQYNCSNYYALSVGLLADEIVR